MRIVMILATLCLLVGATGGAVAQNAVQPALESGFGLRCPECMCPTNVVNYAFDLGTWLEKCKGGYFLAGA